MSSQECADNNFNNIHVPVKLKILAVQFVLQLWIRATTDKSMIEWIHGFNWVSRLERAPPPVLLSDTALQSFRRRLEIDD